MKKSHQIALGVVVALAVVTALVVGRERPNWTDSHMASNRDLNSSSAPIQSHPTYSLVTDTTVFAPQVAGNFVFSIEDERGGRLKDFALSHEKVMHLIVVRQDLQQFAHLHPDFDSRSGEFRQSNLVFATDGPYRLFADFTPSAGQKGADGELLPVTVTKDITVGDIKRYRAEPIGAPQAGVTVGGYAINLTQPVQPKSGTVATLAFTVSQNGQTIGDLQPYLGALGHVVVLKADSLEYIHAHPRSLKQNSDGSVSFDVTFPSAGVYKAFGQFQRQGELLTGGWVLPTVAEGSTQAPESGDIHGH